jgi:CHAD domain-containing protein
MRNPARLCASPVLARPPLIDDLMTREEACRVILFDCLAHLSANIVPVVKGRDSEGLHQLRVALRRLRVAFATFDDDSPAMEALNTHAKTISDKLGPARDLDVFLDELLEPAVAKLESQHAFEILRARAEQVRQRAWQAAVAEISSEGFVRFQDSVAEAAQQQHWPAGDCVAIGVVIPVAMAIHSKQAKKRGKFLKKMDPHECHRLRISLKRLRYAAEFFAPLYKRKTVKTWMAPLKELQDLLGHLNDVAQVRVMMGRLMMEENASLQAELNHAAGLIQDWHQARATRVAKKTLKRWEHFKEVEPFWV